MMRTKKIKNVISNSYRLYLENQLLNSNVWSYLRSVVRTDLTTDDDSFGFTVYRTPFIEPPEVKHEIFYNMLTGLYFNLLDGFELKDIDILRIRLGLILNSGKFIVNTPHVDFDYDHPVANNHVNILYYFNSTNAPTYLYEETSKNIKDTVKYGIENKFKVKEIMNCEVNTAYMFDGSYFHSSSKPTDEKYRLVLNLNGKIYEN